MTVRLRAASRPLADRGAGGAIFSARSQVSRADSKPMATISPITTSRFLFMMDSLNCFRFARRPQSTAPPSNELVQAQPHQGDQRDGARNAYIPQGAEQQDHGGHDVQISFG